MQKFKYKEMIEMFSDEMLIKIFADKEIQTVPIGCQATVLKVVERVLEEAKE